MSSKAQEIADSQDLADPSGPFTVGGFLCKKSDWTENSFYEYWFVKHSAVVIPWALRHGIISYRQYHTPSALRQKWAEMTGSTLIDFDGYAEITFSSFEALMEAFKDPYHMDVVQRDEEVFLDKAATRNIPGGAMLGVAAVVRDVVKDGKAVV